MLDLPAVAVALIYRPSPLLSNCTPFNSQVTSSSTQLPVTTCDKLTEILVALPWKGIGFQQLSVVTRPATVWIYLTTPPPSHRVSRNPTY